jgi:hypothetical protein
MAKAAQFDAKTPSLSFLPDGARKRRGASAPVRMAADKWLGETYRRLERLRVAAL